MCKDTVIVFTSYGAIQPLPLLQHLSLDEERPVQLHHSNVQTRSKETKTTQTRISLSTMCFSVSISHRPLHMSQIWSLLWTCFPSTVLVCLHRRPYPSYPTICLSSSWSPTLVAAFVQRIRDWPRAELWKECEERCSSIPRLDFCLATECQEVRLAGIEELSWERSEFVECAISDWETVLLLSCPAMELSTMAASTRAVGGDQRAQVVEELRLDPGVEVHKLGVHDYSHFGSECSIYT